MASASNWLRVRSICAQVNFIARSYHGFALDIMRCSPSPQGGQRYSSALYLPLDYGIRLTGLG
jgi:hypothetical protein